MTLRSCRLEWRTVMMMLPRRRFSATELTRAAADPPNLSLRLSVLINVVLMLAMQFTAFGRDLPWNYNAVLLLLGLLLMLVLEVVWRDPGSARVHWFYYLATPLLGVVAGAVQVQLGRSHREAAMLINLTVLMVVLGVWFAIVHRHQVIVLRLAELEERDRAVDMARQLGSAQIQPHFLYNTLASLQHWVSSGDARAAPLLAALTGYLRATLPLFEQRWLDLGRELEAVRHYLEVMQARLGERLRFQIAVEPSLLDTRLPPGVLLTLVENAVEHGIEPQLHGGNLWLRGWREGDGLVLRLDDDGPGLPVGELPGAEQGHLGLANTRARLQQAFGDRARLGLDARAGGGCRAELHLPWQPASAAEPPSSLAEP